MCPTSHLKAVDGYTEFHFFKVKLKILLELPLAIYSDLIKDSLAFLKLSVQKIWSPYGEEKSDKLIKPTDDVMATKEKG